MAFGFMNTAFAVTYNKEQGFIDRFRSMPMASSAVVTDAGWPTSSTPRSTW